MLEKMTNGNFIDLQIDVIFGSKRTFEIFFQNSDVAETSYQLQVSDNVVLVDSEKFTKLIDRSSNQVLITLG